MVSTQKSSGRQPARPLIRDRHGAGGRVGRLLAVELTERPGYRFVRQSCDPGDSASHRCALGHVLHSGHTVEAVSNSSVRGMDDTGRMSSQ